MFMDEDPYGFGTYLLLGALFLVLVLMTVPPKHKELRILGVIFIALAVVTLGGPLIIKSDWVKYHEFHSGQIHEVKDVSGWIDIYRRYGPAGPAVFDSILYIFAVGFLICCLPMQYKEWRKKKPE